MGLAEGFATGFGLATDAKRRKREDAWRDEQQARTRLGWQREDDVRAGYDQLGADLQMGGRLEQQPGYEDATGGLETAAPGKRVALKRSEVQGRLGSLALKAGDVKGFQAADMARSQLEEDELISQALKAEPDAKLAQYINSNHKSLTIGEPDKQGFRPMSVVRADGTAMFHNLSAGDQKKLSAAQALMERNPMRALQMIGEVNKELAATVAADNGLTMGVGKEGNDAAFRRGTLANDADRTKMMDRHNRATEAQAGANAKLDRMGSPVQMVGPDGQPRFVVPIMGPAGMRFQDVPVPAGFRMPRQVDPTQQRQLAMEMVGQPTGRLVEGKPELFTAEVAWSAAGRMLRGDSAGGPGGVDPRSDAAKILEAQKRGTPAQQRANQQQEVDDSYVSPPKKAMKGPDSWLQTVPGMGKLTRTH